MPRVPQELLMQEPSYLQPGDEASFCTLRWSIDSVIRGKDNAELNLVIAVANYTTSTINNQGMAIPFLKDVFGHFAFPVDGIRGLFTRMPKDLRPGEYCKVRLTFDITSMEVPVYLCIQKGLLPDDAEKVIWLVIPD
jgi:hypothetical protein